MLYPITLLYLRWGNALSYKLEVGERPYERPIALYPYYTAFIEAPLRASVCVDVHSMSEAIIQRLSYDDEQLEADGLDVGKFSRLLYVAPAATR